MKCATWPYNLGTKGRDVLSKEADWEHLFRFDRQALNQLQSAMKIQFNRPTKEKTLKTHFQLSLYIYSIAQPYSMISSLSERHD